MEESTKLIVLRKRPGVSLFIHKGGMIMGALDRTWFVHIKRGEAVRYEKDGVKTDRRRDGFMEDGGGVWLRHRDAKIKLKGSEVEVIRAAIRDAKAGVWRVGEKERAVHNKLRKELAEAAGRAHLIGVPRK